MIVMFSPVNSYAVKITLNICIGRRNESNTRTPYRMGTGDIVQSNYIVRTKDDVLLSFYYSDQYELHYKLYENNKWSEKRRIIDNVKDTYSITMSSDGTIYLFCQDREGNIILCQSDSLNEWVTKVILRNQSSKIHRIFFNGLIDENGLNLIYNVPIPDEDSHHLMSQSVNNRGEWSEAKTIDKIISLPNKLFDMQPITKSHSLLFYQKRTPENRLGYREFTVTALSDYHIFHTTGYHILETSFLTTSNAIHVLYVVKSMFSIQILYRKKESHAFTNPIVIWEAQKLSNCMLTIIENNLYATWVSASQLYYSVSTDLGNSFKRPVKYNNRFSQTAIKANYISYEAMAEHQFVCHELYVNKDNICDILFLPDMYKNFHPAKVHRQAKKVPPRADVFEPRPPSPPKELAPLEKLSMDYMGMGVEYENDETEKLKNKLLIYKKQLDEKDKQIMQLTRLLQTRNEEIASIDDRWRIKYRTLMDDKDTFERSRNTLMKENERLKNKIKALEEKYSTTYTPDEPEQPEQPNEKPHKNELLILKDVTDTNAEAQYNHEGDATHEDYLH